MIRLVLPTALLSLLLPASAVAGVTSSSVTTPADTVTRLVGNTLPADDPASSLLVAGTAAGLPGDDVDIRCARRDPDGTVNTGDVFDEGASVPVVGGTFARTVSLSGMARGCRIVATPATVQPPDATPFTGPRFWNALDNRFTLDSGPNAGLVINHVFASARPTLDVLFTSIGHGGAPWDMAPVDDGGDLPYYAERLWGGNADLRATSSAPGTTRSSLQVDGVNAFAPDVAWGLYGGAYTASGLAPITIRDVSVDQATGDVTHASTEPFVTCPTDGGSNVTAVAATPENCPFFVPSGVAVQRTVVVRPATRSVETKDRWVSTDGRPHTLDALYNQAQRTAGRNGYRFPWVDGAAFRMHQAGDEIAPPPGRVASLFVKVKADAPDDDPRYTQGSLTVSPAPDLIRFTDDDFRFEIGFRRTVPATGALAIEQRFTVGTRLAEVQAQAQVMEQRAAAGLAIAITSPTQVSGYDPSYTVSGATSAVSGVRSVLVNGTAVATKPDGTWSLPMRLAPGANALTATVTDDAGDSVTTSGIVTFSPGPAQATVLTAGVRKGILSARLRCQTVPGATCTGRVKLTARITRVKKTRRGKRRSTKTVTLASRAYALPAGDGAIRTVRLSKANRALVRKYRIKRATLTLTQTVGTFTKTTKTSVPVRL